MYCGSCLHDNTLAAALLALGEDVLLVPTYTPLRTDEDNVSDAHHLFFGGINVYLQQHSALFRHTPWFLDALLDRPAVLQWATQGGPTVEPERLGDLTVSMLAGEHGRQRKEIRKLVRWLERDGRPDVVHLSNAMLLGMAREIRKLGVPVVCSLSGEDIFLEKLIEPFYSQARDLLRERVADADGLVALNNYYAEAMADYLGVPRSRISVVPHGLNLAGHGHRRDEADGVFTIGYFARICADKGLHNLIAAMEILLEDASLPPIRLRAGGYMSQMDRGYLDTIVNRTAGWKDPRAFHYVGEVSRAEKIAFMQGLNVMALPTEYRESKGISVLEAWANAVPVVLPAHGTFPELVELSGGGLLYDPHDPRGLADALRRFILDRTRAAELGVLGKQSVERNFNAALMADRTRDVYRGLLGRGATA